MPGRQGSPDSKSRSGPEGPKRPLRAGSRARRPAREDRLLTRLKAAEESLRAIPSRHVDALVVLGSRGARVVTLQGGDSAYRMLVEAMSEGAATVSSDGAVLYCNRRFAELIGRPPGKLIGTEIQSIVHEPERQKVIEFLRSARSSIVKGEFTLQRHNSGLVPVQLSLS